MQKIIPTSFPEVKSSLETLRNAFTSSLHQLVVKGNELQQVAEHLVTGTVARDFPRCDMVEGGGELLILFELPGLAREDFQLEIGGGLLTLRGEKKSRIQGRGAAIHLGECLYGAFERTISLPVKVTEEKAVAELTAGVLVVTIPKAEAGDHPKHPIPIK